MRIIASTTQEGGVTVEILGDNGSGAPAANGASPGVAASGGTEALDGGASPLSTEPQTPQRATEPLQEIADMDGGAGPAP